MLRSPPEVPVASPESVVAACAYIGAVYRSRFAPPTETELAVWSDVLSDVSDSALGAAVRAWCRSDAEWPPTPGQLRSEAQGEVRVYADAAHRPYESQPAALESGFPDPLASLQQVRDEYERRTGEAS